ncbi:MAG TPA: helix-turn-helix domain-containing protein [Acidimicrobiales bacterium]
MSHPLLDALVPVAEALGAEIVGPDDVTGADIPLRWEDRLVGGLRLPQMQGALDRLIDGVERELGGRLRDLSREDKQRAVRLLEERGAFLLRRSVEDVADALGVSRITVYNYLNAIRDRGVRR